jgi:arylsulfatase A-like enzyme
VIKDDALQSNPWRAPRVVPPESAPNVLLIITDDAGFAVPSTSAACVFSTALSTAVLRANGGLRLAPSLVQ